MMSGPLLGWTAIVTTVRNIKASPSRCLTYSPPGPQPGVLVCRPVKPWSLALSPTGVLCPAPVSVSRLLCAQPVAALSRYPARATAVQGPLPGLLAH